MLRHEDRLLDLVGAIHLAAADPDPAAWPGALERLCDGMGGGFTMMVDHRLPGTIVDCAEARCLPAWKALCFERFNEPGTNPLLDATPRMPVGVPVTLHQLLDMASARSRVAYDEFVKVCDGYDHVGMVLDREPDRSITMGFGRTRAEGPLTPADCDLLSRLLPHLTGAALVRRRLAVALPEAEAARAALAALDRGVVLLDAAGRAVWANAAAERLLARRDGLALGYKGALVAARPAETAALRRLVATAAAAGADAGLEAGGALALPRPSRRRPLVARVVPLAPEVGLPGMPRLLPRRPAAALLVSDPDEVRAPPEKVLAQAYGLTRAEAALAARLVGGASLRDAADALTISENTAKSQLKSVYAKLDVDRQSALVRRVLADLGGVADGTRQNGSR